MLLKNNTFRPRIWGFFVAFCHILVDQKLTKCYTVFTVNKQELAMFLVYDKATTQVMRKGPYCSPLYKTEAAAKAFLTRMTKMGYRREDYSVAEHNDFYENIEQTVEVTNLMTGKRVKQSVNTPHCCDVSSETYWSM
jgi:hypothetical protein